MSARTMYEYMINNNILKYRNGQTIGNIKELYDMIPKNEDHIVCIPDIYAQIFDDIRHYGEDEDSYIYFENNETTCYLPSFYEIACESDSLDDKLYILTSLKHTLNIFDILSNE